MLGNLHIELILKPRFILVQDYITLTTIPPLELSLGDNV